jgi:hypothetical protein
MKTLNVTLRAESKIKEELGLSNSSLEDRIHKLEMEREQLKLKSKQQLSNIEAKDELLRESNEKISQGSAIHQDLKA